MFGARGPSAFNYQGGNLKGRDPNHHHLTGNIRSLVVEKKQ